MPSTVFDSGNYLTGSGADGPAAKVLNKLINASRQTNKAGQLEMVRQAMSEFKILVDATPAGPTKDSLQKTYAVAVTEQKLLAAGASTATLEERDNTPEQIQLAIKEIINFDYTPREPGKPEMVGWLDRPGADTDIKRLVRTYWLSRIIKADNDANVYRYSEGATKTLAMYNANAIVFLPGCDVTGVQGRQQGRTALSNQLLNCAVAAYNKKFPSQLSIAPQRASNYTTDGIYTRRTPIRDPLNIELLYYTMKKVFPALGPALSPEEIESMITALTGVMSTGPNAVDNTSRPAAFKAASDVLAKTRELIAAPDTQKDELKANLANLVVTRDEALNKYRATSNRTPVSPPSPPPSPPPAATTVDDDGELAKQLAEQGIAKNAVSSSLNPSNTRTAADAWKAAQDTVVAKAQEIASSAAAVDRAPLRTQLVGLRNTTRDEKTYYTAVKNKAEATVETDIQKSNGPLLNMAGNWGVKASDMMTKIVQINTAPTEEAKTPLRTERDDIESEMLRAKYTYYNGAASATETDIRTIPSRTPAQTAFLQAATALKTATANVATDAKPNYVSFTTLVDDYKNARASLGTIAVRPTITVIKVDDVFVKGDDAIRIMLTDGEDVYILLKQDSRITTIDDTKTSLKEFLNDNGWSQSQEANALSRNRNELKYTLTVIPSALTVEIGASIDITYKVTPQFTTKLTPLAQLTIVRPAAKIAKIKPGKLEGVSVGTATISVKSVPLNLVSASVDITVTGPTTSSSSRPTVVVTPDIAVNDYYFVKEGTTTTGVVKITKIDDTYITYDFLDTTQANSKVTKGDQRIKAQFLSMIDDTKQLKYITKMSEENVTDFKEIYSEMTGGARKNRRTRNRKTNLRRKTGKRSKPSRPSQSSSQQLF